MEQPKNNKSVIALLIIIIVIIGGICCLLLTGQISFKSDVSDNNIQKDNNNSIDNNQTNTDNNTQEPANNTSTNYTVKSVTNAKFNIFWDNIEREIEVVDGKLVVDGNTYSIENERIKYFYYNRYQCSHGTVLYYLTESGNVYVTDMSAGTDNLELETLNNFKKLDYSNVTDIVVIPNDNYGKPLDSTSGMTDNVKEYLYVLVNGETFKLDYQYRC